MFLCDFAYSENTPDSLIRNENANNKSYAKFMMKTLKINWEGNPNSFMHVLIDTTNVAQLEEAKNNIKCQKIMFTSASHEFRTPLNAIMNSFGFIKNTHKIM